MDDNATVLSLCLIPRPALDIFTSVMEEGGVAMLLAETAIRFPDRPALLTATTTTSYADLHGQSGRLAASLRLLGVCHGDRVVLAISEAFQYLVSYYGVLKAGAVVVPINSDTRSAILIAAVAHSDARAVILDAANLPLLRGQWQLVRTLDYVVVAGQPSAEMSSAPQIVELSALLATSDEVHDSGAASADLATIAYTSGTTGEPKGVMLSHGNILANVRSVVRYLALCQDDVVAMVLPFHYAYGTSVMLTHVATGGALAMVGSIAFPAAVLRAMQDFHCTGLSGVPSTFAHLVRTDVSQFDLSSLRYLTQAGGPMSPELTKRVMATFAGRLFVMYGQTEATARLTYVPPERLAQKPGSVGIPIPDVAIDLVDDSGAAVTDGPGEVVARGPNVMIGYWKDPHATAQTLCADGLHTGDVGWRDSDGYLYLVARKSEMIKSGGHRIGPREIEETVESLAGVAECAVVGIADELLGEAIAAVVVTADGITLEAEAVQRHVLKHLPRHKVPTIVKFAEHLPRTASGKVRRSELRELVSGQDRHQTGAKNVLVGSA